MRNSTFMSQGQAHPAYHRRPDLPLTSEAFRRDVLAGLAAVPKHLPSRYLYDAEGDRIFQRIMACADYYPTRSEAWIFRHRAAGLYKALANGRRTFRLFELGAGDGTKTMELLRHALAAGAAPVYQPIDISAHVLHQLKLRFDKDLPGVQVQPVQGEYQQAIAGPIAEHAGAKCVLFLGSNIGNLVQADAIGLLRMVRNQLRRDDRLLVGFDLKKDPATILRAYNDRDGWTRAFNLNLLRRINRELGADFDLERFVHVPVYDPVSARALSYLVSTCEQEVRLPGAPAPVRFGAWETLHTEISQKYDDALIAELAHRSGLKVVADFRDREGWFADVVFASAEDHRSGAC